MPDDYYLLGLALVAAQRVEFALYGIAAHASHTPPAQKERRFRELTAETFLRGDSDQLTATLGQLVERFGDAFLIKTDDLVAYYKDRNLIAHDYWRTYCLDIGKRADPGDGRDFLTNFLQRSLRWEAILKGLLYELMKAAASRHGREADLNLPIGHETAIAAYQTHAARILNARDRNLREADDPSAGQK